MGAREVESEPVELVWDVVDSGGSEPWLIVLPRPVFEDHLEVAEAWRCSTWGELRAAASRHIYEDICWTMGYDPDPDLDGSDDAAPPDDAELEWGSDGVSAPWGSVWRLMWDHWPGGAPIDDEMILDTMHDGHLLLVPGARAEPIVAGLRERGHATTRDHRMWALLPQRW